jgi:hypothetical protein
MWTSLEFCCGAQTSVGPDHHPRSNLHCREVERLSHIECNPQQDITARFFSEANANIRAVTLCKSFNMKMELF